MEFSLHSVFWCGSCCAMASSQEHLCILKLVFAHLREVQSSARLQQTEGQKSSLWTTLLLLQTGSTRKDWAGGLKPHFCSISFGNPISQLNKSPLFTACPWHVALSIRRYQQHIGSFCPSPTFSPTILEKDLSPFLDV